MARLNIGVLVSGRGSNLQALLDASLKKDLGGGQIVVVVSNVAGVQSLDRAKAAGVPSEVVEHKRFPDRAAFDRALVEALKKHQVELVCLAGFMRLVTPAFLDAFPGRVLNIHPSLLPSFPGMHGAGDAIAHGVRFSGCTVHFVDKGTDSGPILAQAIVPVLPGDDEAALSARILQAEHRIYPQAIRWVASGKVTLSGRRAIVADTEVPATEPAFNPPIPSPAPRR